MPEDAESHLQERTQGKRIFALDALRGLAAFIVLLHHFRNAFFMNQPRWFLVPVFAGHSAVILFFVLSGYVLSLPYWAGRRNPYPAYLVRRVCRIYLPFAAAVAVAVVVAKPLLFAQLPLTSWFYMTWHAPITLRLIADNLFGMSVAHKLNTAFWSLRYEMEMSLVFPGVCWLMSRLGFWPSVLLTWAIAIAGLQVWVRFGLAETGNTLFYGSCFLIGALLSWKKTTVRELYPRTPLWLKLVLAACIVYGYYNVPHPLYVPLAACGIIILAEHSCARRLLDTPIPEYLGRVSYSLYLVHGTVLFASLILLYGRIPIAAVFTIYMVAAFVAAHLFCTFVEEPSMRLGKRFSSRM